MARLYSTPEFKRHLHEQFEGDYKIHFHLAAPMIAQRDLEDGHMIKREFGPLMLKAFGILKHFKFLRGTAFDIFGREEERKQERQLIKEYEATITKLLEKLNSNNLDLAIEIAGIPEYIRGYGHVKAKHIDDAKANESILLDRFNNPDKSKLAAE